MSTSPFSATVLGSAALVASPALYQAFVLDTMPFDVAIIRYLIAMLIVWVGIAVLVDLVGSPPPPGDQSGQESALSETAQADQGD